MNNRCQIAGHSEFNVITLCLDTQCTGKRSCCSMCQAEFHSKHINQVIDQNFLKNFIQSQSQLPSSNSKQVIEALKYINEALELIDGLQKIFLEQKYILCSANLQTVCKNLGDQYNIAQEQLDNKKWNELAQDLLPYFQMRDGKLIFKDQLEKNLEQNYFQLMKEFQQDMTKIINRFKTINYIIDPNPFLKLAGPTFLQDHTQYIIAIDICEQKNLIVSGGYDMTVKLWNSQKNTLLKTYKNDYYVNDVVFSSQGDLIAYGGRSEIINLIEINDLINQDKVSELKGQDSILRLNFSNDAKYLISSSFDKSICVWNVKAMEQHFKYTQDSLAYSVMINNDNTFIACSFGNGEIKFWDFENSKLICSQKANNYITKIQISNDQQKLLSNGQDNIKLWSLTNLNQGQLSLIKEFKALHNDIRTALLTSDSRFIITYCSSDKQVKVLDSNTGEQIKQFELTLHMSVYTGFDKILAISKNMSILGYVNDEKIVVQQIK